MYSHSAPAPRKDGGGERDRISQHMLGGVDRSSGYESGRGDTEEMLEGKVVGENRKGEYGKEIQRVFALKGATQIILKTKIGLTA